MSSLPDRWRRTTVGDRLHDRSHLPEIDWASTARGSGAGSSTRSGSSASIRRRTAATSPPGGTATTPSGRRSTGRAWRSSSMRSHSHATAGGVSSASRRRSRADRRMLETDPRIAPQWRAFLRLMPQVFGRYPRLVDRARRALPGVRRSPTRSTATPRAPCRLARAASTRPPDAVVSLKQVIVAHLDLDAFYAAVEELENPELRSQPLVVGGDPRGRGVVATANYVARRFGIHSAMSAAEAMRRCPHAVFVRPRHSLYREYSRHVWSTVRGIVPTVEQTGLDEGYLDLGEVARDFLDARVVAEAVQTAVRGATSSDVLARRCAVQGRREGGERRAQAGRPRRRRTRPGSGVPRAARRSPAAGRRAEGRGAAACGGVETVGALAALPTTSCGGCCRAASATCCATVRAASTRAGSSLDTESASRSASRTRSSATSCNVSGCTDELRAHGAPGRRVSAAERPGGAHGDDEAALRRLLHPQPVDSLDVGIDDAEQIARARVPPARPRPARPARRAAPRRRRRVGLAAYRQLALDAV